MPANVLHDRCLLGIDPDPWQRAVRQPQYPLRDDALGPVQAGKEDSVCFAHAVSDDRALSQFEVERRLDQSPRNLRISSASCAGSAVGRPQCPSSIASVSA